MGKILLWYNKIDLLRNMPRYSTEHSLIVFPSGSGLLQTGWLERKVLYPPGSVIFLVWDSYLDEVNRGVCSDLTWLRWTELMAYLLGTAGEAG